MDRFYTGLLALAMRWRTAVAVVALAVVATSIPLYQQVRQEYLPSHADEGEFDVNISAGEGTGLAAMDEVARLVE